MAIAGPRHPRSVVRHDDDEATWLHGQHHAMGAEVDDAVDDRGLHLQTLLQGALHDQLLFAELATVDRLRDRVVDTSDHVAQLLMELGRQLLHRERRAAGDERDRHVGMMGSGRVGLGL